MKESEIRFSFHPFRSFVQVLRLPEHGNASGFIHSLVSAIRAMVSGRGTAELRGSERISCGYLPRRYQQVALVILALLS